MILLALATIVAVPGTLPAAIAVAQPGDTITVRAGDHGAVRIVGRQFAKRVKINLLSGARMSVVVQKSRGITFRNGTFTNPKGYAAQVQLSDDVSFLGSRFVDSTHGLVIDRSTDVLVSKARFTGFTVDGADIASSQRVEIRDSMCADSRAVPPTHPDCIQAWSRPATGITSDVKLLRNTATGSGMQGFTFFNHVRNGIDDGGFDRVTVSGNVVTGDYPQGIALYDCRDCTVTNNEARTIPGAKYRVSINVVRSTGTVSGNIVGAKR